jgi:4-alpha-glucanotransferase
MRGSPRARRTIKRFNRGCTRCASAPLVDHPAVCEIKLSVLRELFTSFGAQHVDAADPRRRSFDAFVAQQGETLERFAEFEALRLQRAAAGLPVDDWHAWPDELRNPQSPALARFRIESAAQIAFQMYLQWEAARQLEAAAAAARAAGLELVLYRDLAVGAARDSAEAWGDQALIAKGSASARHRTTSAATDRTGGCRRGIRACSPNVLTSRSRRCSGRT